MRVAVEMDRSLLTEGKAISGEVKQSVREPFSVRVHHISHSQEERLKHDVNFQKT
jgi:hypothetical protein